MFISIRCILELRKSSNAALRIDERVRGRERLTTLLEILDFPELLEILDFPEL